jgi:prephenate dehydrogenase
MGGSLALALRRKAGYKDVVCVTRNAAALKAALADGAVTAGSTGDYSLFRDCGAVFLCMPVEHIPEAAEKIAPFLKPGAVITDVGSVKGGIARKMAETDIGAAAFVGGHPMTGSEKSGYENATETLFENAYYIICGEGPAAAAVSKIAEDAGAVPVMLSPERHDALTAAVSHGPHVIAAALVNAVSALNDETARLIAAGGFRDITRIASSDPELWRGISFENRKELLGFLAAFRARVSAFEEALKNEDSAAARAFFADARDYRDSLPARLPLRGVVYDIRLEAADSPGEIARVAAILARNGVNIKNIEVTPDREHAAGALRVELGSAADKQTAVSVLRKAGMSAWG